MRHLFSFLGDLALVALATIVALLLRENFEYNAERFEAFVPYFAATIAAACFALPAFGTSRLVWRYSSIADYLRVLWATVVIVGLAVLLGFGHNRLYGIARSLPVLQGLLILFFVVGARVLFRLYHSSRVRPAQLTRASLTYSSETVLIVGLTRLTELYLRSVAELAGDRVQIAGLLGRHDRQTGRLVHQYKVLGTPEELGTILKDLEVHGIFVSRIVVTVDFQSLSETARQLLLQIERTTPIRLDILAENLGLAGKSTPKNRQTDESTSGALTFSIDDSVELPLQRRLYWRFKRAFDIGLAMVLTIILAPIIVLVSILVALDVGFPVAFWQKRPGLGGYPFSLYKFRTMAAAHDQNGNRLADSERVSSIGKFLRRTRLDELPQVYNVLVGEMSFVGPRPLLPIDQPAAFAARLQIRPGLTGWAQIQGGREISAADKAALDIWYVHHASAWRDLQIMAATISTVIYGERPNLKAIRRAWEDLVADGICQPASREAAAATEH